MKELDWLVRGGDGKRKRHKRPGLRHEIDVIEAVCPRQITASPCMVAPVTFGSLDFGVHIFTHWLASPVTTE